MQTDFEQPRDRKLPKHTAFFPGLPPPSEPPIIPVEPLTDKQFEFIVKALANERTDKAARLNAERDLDPYGDQYPAFDPATVPVLIWADPRTFERMVDYAARMIERMNTPAPTPTAHRMTAGLKHQVYYRDGFCCCRKCGLEWRAVSLQECPRCERDEARALAVKYYKAWRLAQRAARQDAQSKKA